MKKVIIYTDGACSYNPGPGGWGAILMYKSNKKEISGGEENTTNNRMELMAVIMGLSALKERCEVEVYSDSTYVVNNISDGNLNTWIMRGWRTADKKPVKNQDLWERLFDLMQKHVVKFIKVKGHADNEYNNRCDALARAEIVKLHVDPA